eukprot:94301_1
MSNTCEKNEAKQNDASDASSSLMTKLKHILENVTSQESVLQTKTSHIEQWYNMHKSALSNASKVKNKLTEFEPINEATDSQEIKDKKTQNKNTINMSLDNLSHELNVLSQSESQYRSTECVDELKQKTDSIHELKKKHNILLAHNKSLLQQNTNHDQKIKLLTEQHDILMETTKKTLFDRHKDYVEHLQHQHESQLKSAQVQHENQITYEISKLKKEHATEMDTQLNELKLNMNTQFERERDELLKERDLLKQNHIALEEDMSQQKDLLAKYVELDKEHQELATTWGEEKKRLKSELLESKESEMKTAEKILEVQNENNKLQQHAVKHSLSSIKHAEKIDKLNLQILELKSLHQSDKKQLSELHAKYELLSTQNTQIKQEKGALIKEVKRLRQSIAEKDAKKSELLTEMSQNERQHLKIVKALKKEHANVNQRFEQLIQALTDCNSHIENFSDTINNFSYSGLMDSYDNNEYDARCKSTELLNDTLININDEIIKTHSEIHLNKIKDDLKEIETNEVKLKSLFDEGDIQISYIRVAVLKLLMEYIESIKGCNDVYMAYNKPNINGNEMENDGVLNYVSSGVSAVATLVNPFSWNQTNELDQIDIDQVRESKNKAIADETVATVEKDGASVDNGESEEEDDIDSISQHYLAKSEFLSVTDSCSMDNGNEAIQVSITNGHGVIQ